MSEKLRDLARRAPGAGRLTGAAHRARVEHPICGDELEVDVQLDGDRITAVAWRARGCPATMAVAACLPGAWTGETTATAPARLKAELARLGGLAVHEAHAEQLATRALAQAAARSEP